MDNYIIVHGSFGSKDGNWFPWIKKELEKREFKVDVPQMPVGVGNQNYENWSKELDKICINENTIIVAPREMMDIINKIKFKEYVFMNPNEETNIDNVIIKTLPAYNIEKPFHPKSNNWLGYVVSINGVTYYVACDTDRTEEAENVKYFDIEFLELYQVIFNQN